MRKLLDSRIRIALLVAVVAAAISIPALALGSASSAPSVHAAKKKKKGKRGPRGKRGKRGLQGPPGKDGVNGKTGPRGPSDVYETVGADGTGVTGVELTLPAGNWAVDGEMQLENAATADAPNQPTANHDGNAECDLASQEDPGDSSFQFVNVPATGFTIDDAATGSKNVIGGDASATPEGVFRLPSGGTVSFACFDSDESDQTGMLYLDPHIRAVQVATAHSGSPVRRQPRRASRCHGGPASPLSRCAGRRAAG